MAFSQWLAATTVLTLAASPVPAQLTKEERVCQQAAAKQCPTFLGKKIKCLVGCDKQALKGKVPAADCLPPFGGKTLACVTTAATKALAGIAEKCADDCPECYAGGDCSTHASMLLAGIEAHVDLVAPLVGCDDAASPDGLTKNEAKVRQKVALVVGTFVAATEKCLAKCRKAEGEGKVAPGSCDYGAETDTKTIECLIKAGNKALDVVEDPELDAPECLAPELSFTLPIAAGLIEEFDPAIFCGSPSPAFVAQTPILR